MVTIEEAQANSELMNVFIEENMGLVKMVLKQLRLPQSEDLLQEATIGLFKAASRFEPEREFQFSTYAVPMIIGEIRRYRRDRDYLHHTGGLKVPRDIRKIYYKSLDFEGYDDSDICQKLNITKEQLDEARIAMSICKSFDIDVHQEDDGDAPITLHSVVPSSYNVEEEATDKIALDEIKSIAVENFGERAARIIELSLSGLTQAEVGKIVNISQVQVSRTLKKIGRLINPRERREEHMNKQKITPEQLLEECREHGIGKEAQKLIADKYGMTHGSVLNLIYKYRINKLLGISKRTSNQSVQISQSVSSVVEQVNKSTAEPEPAKAAEAPKRSTLRVKAWDGKENTYSIEDGKLLITNEQGTLTVTDIKAMIQELQELGEYIPAV
jgi:RNA polymerase sigma factor (sigma-70 family)